MNKDIMFCKSGDQKICVEKDRDEVRLWKFDENFEFYTVYTADKLNIEGDLISLEAEKFFRVSFWEDMFDEPDERAEELFDTFPDDLPELNIHVSSKNHIYE